MTREAGLMVLPVMVLCFYLVQNVAVSDNVAPSTLEI